MRLAKLIIELRYDEPPRGFGGLGAVLARTFAEELGPDVQVPRDPVIRHVLNFMRDGVVFGADANRTGVDLNWPEDEQRAAARALAYLDKGQRALQLDPLSRVGIRTVWVDPRDVTFEELVTALKNAWLREDSELTRQSMDVGVALVHRHRDNRVNVSIGPIRAEEFSRWALPPIEDLSARPMLLVDIDYAFAGRLRYGPLVRLETILEVLSYARTIADQAATESITGEGRSQ